MNILKIKNVLHVPESSMNMVSAAKCLTSGLTLKGKGAGFDIFLQDQQIGRAPIIGNL